QDVIDDDPFSIHTAPDGHVCWRPPTALEALSTAVSAPSASPVPMQLLRHRSDSSSCIAASSAAALLQPPKQNPSLTAPSHVVLCFDHNKGIREWASDLNLQCIDGFEAIAGSEDAKLEPP